MHAIFGAVITWGYMTEALALDLFSGFRCSASSQALTVLLSLLKKNSKFLDFCCLGFLIKQCKGLKSRSIFDLDKAYLRLFFYPFLGIQLVFRFSVTIHYSSCLCNFNSLLLYKTTKLKLNVLLFITLKWLLIFIK